MIKNPRCATQRKKKREEEWSVKEKVQYRIGRFLFAYYTLNYIFKNAHYVVERQGKIFTVPSLFEEIK